MNMLLLKYLFFEDKIIFFEILAISKISLGSASISYRMLDHLSVIYQNYIWQGKNTILGLDTT